MKDLALKTLNKQGSGLEEGVKHLTDRVYHLLREVGRIGTQLALVVRRVEKLELGRHRASVPVSSLKSLETA